MIKTVVDSDTLKLTVDDQGIVWYLSGEGMPHSSGQSDWDFLNSSILKEAEHVRMVGSANNAELIHRLYELRLKHELDSLQVCSPACCDTVEDRGDSEVILFKMRTYNLASSLGGWHEFGLKDYPSYLLAAHFRRHTKTSDYTRQATYSHAAWPALSFIETINIDALSKLLGLIIDPRWFVDMTDDNNVTYLEQHLGLTTRSMSAIGTNDRDLKTDRCQLVLDCWKTTSDITPSTPRNFLWRTWASKGGNLRGDFAASRLFVSFLRATWTKAVCSMSQADHLFVPKYFFENDDEARAYEEHERTFKPQS